MIIFLWVLGLVVSYAVATLIQNTMHNYVNTQIRKAYDKERSQWKY